MQRPNESWASIPSLDLDLESSDALLRRKVDLAEFQELLEASSSKALSETGRIVRQGHVATKYRACLLTKCRSRVRISSDLLHARLRLAVFRVRLGIRAIRVI